MKSIYNIKYAIVGVAAIAAVSCTYDPYDTDIAPVEETMTLKCETPEVQIDDQNLTSDALVFTWTGARPMSDEYMSLYKAELDVLGNSFGSKTVISSGVGFDYHFDEETGIYTASFTNEQLNNWYNERWALPVNKPFTVEFRVVAQFTGGPQFEMPEVRKVSAVVTPIHVDIFDCDRMTIAGNAIEAETEVKKTYENENVYAWKGTLTPGELLIPVEFDGATYYLQNANGNDVITDGEPMPVVMNENRKAWTVPEVGEYRIVINMTDKTATIYSAATDLKPLVVTFHPNGADTNPLATVEVTTLHAYGGGTGWGVKTLNLIQSAADPQILIFDGSVDSQKTLGGSIKFCVAKSFQDEKGTSYNQNNAYCFSSPLNAEGKRQTLAAELGKPFELGAGATGENRNSYINIPSGSNFIIFDLRHNLMTCYKK